MTPDQRKYLTLLSEKFPTIQTVYTEIINLEAILNLPSATEHFMSDVHGEYEAFYHILNNCSGVIRERVGRIFRFELTLDEQADLCTLIYYPRQKLARMREEGVASEQTLAITLMRLMRLARHLSYAYTRSKVRKAMPVAYAFIIDELLHATHDERATRQAYHSRIVDSIIETGSADDFIVSACTLIKRLAVDRLHMVGDFFDRGPRADAIIDQLRSYHSVDIQWGNHDVMWMGAAAGSEACIASVIRTNIHYGTLDILERAYGVSLRELYLFAESTYHADDGMTSVEKAVDVILFKLEGQLIKRHPDWEMDDRLLLHRVDREQGTVEIGGAVHALRTREFPTVDAADPYALSREEQEVMAGIVESFRASKRLKSHIGFLYEHGAVYLIRNGNVLFHGCMPMEEDGSFARIRHQGTQYEGRAYFDLVDRIARRAWSQRDIEALDWMWYLWCGRYSPMSGRLVKTFEHAYLEDQSMWKEPQDPYYELTKSPEVCDMILAEFGLSGPHCHIINGHTPVHVGAGESPLRAGGRLIVIDGGFCRAYHKRTGIAGYTLISDPSGMRIKAHRPFASIDDALDSNADILSEDDRFEIEEEPLQVKDTDTGDTIRTQIADLRALLDAYRSGDLKERGNG